MVNNIHNNAFNPQKAPYDLRLPSTDEKAKLSILVKAQQHKSEKNIAATISKCGFISLSSGLPTNDFASYFSTKIGKYGPGILVINHPIHGKISVVLKRVFKKDGKDVADLVMLGEKTALLSDIMKHAVKKGNFLQMTDQKTWDKREKEQLPVVVEKKPIPEKKRLKFNSKVKQITYYKGDSNPLKLSRKMPTIIPLHPLQDEASDTCLGRAKKIIDSCMEKCHDLYAQCKDSIFSDVKNSPQKMPAIVPLQQIPAKQAHILQNPLKDGYTLVDLSTRAAPLGLVDTFIRERDPKTGLWQKVSKHGSGFIIPKNNPQCLIKIEPMKFLKEPEGFQKRSVAITEDGRHVILQQATRSCVPTAMAMLILDHGKEPSWNSIRFTNLADNEKACYWLKEANLEPIVTEITGKDGPAALAALLQKNGPAAVGINHPELGGHEIIIDRVFPDRDEADIRDPYQGVALRIKLKSLLSWCFAGETFIQVKEKK